MEPSLACPRLQPDEAVASLRTRYAAVASSCRLPRGQRCPSGSLCSAARTWSMIASGPCSARTCQEARPVEQAEAVDQAGRAVAEHGRSVQAIAGNGVGQGVLGGGRVGAGDPEAVGMVAVAALLGDQLGEAAGMVGGAGGVLVHGAVLDGGDVLQAVVGDHPDAGRLLQQDGGVAQHQVVNGLGLLAEDGDGGRGAAGMAEVAGVGVQGGDVGDRLGQAVGWAMVGLGGEQGEELCRRGGGRTRPCRGQHPVPSSGGTEAPSTTTTALAVAAMKSSLLVASGERREARVTCMAVRAPGVGRAG